MLLVTYIEGARLAPRVSVRFGIRVDGGVATSSLFAFSCKIASSPAPVSRPCNRVLVC